jgi:hypothetical protein
MNSRRSRAVRRIMPAPHGAPGSLVPLAFSPCSLLHLAATDVATAASKVQWGAGREAAAWDGDGGFVFFLRSRSRQIPFCVPSALRAIGERLSYSHSANHKVVADFFLPEGWRVTVTHPPPSPSFRTRSTVTQHPCPTMACLSASFSLAAVASKRAAVRTKTR